LIGKPVDIFAFPYGDFNDAVVDAAKVATTPRDSLLDFCLKVCGGYDWMPMASRAQEASLAKVGVTAQSMAIEVRQATLGDYPAIEAFIREAYEDLAPYKAHDRLALAVRRQSVRQARLGAARVDRTLGRPGRGADRPSSAAD
jgi:hypothetical protein